MPDAAIGVSPSSWRAKPPTLAIDGYTLSDVQQAVAQQVLARLQLSRSRVMLQSYDRLERRYDAVVAIESLGHPPTWRQRFAIGPGSYGPRA
jgi:cyclopropane fatty-acyl-phospholipid synthase-like methyltransferase